MSVPPVSESHGTWDRVLPPPPGLDVELYPSPPRSEPGGRSGVPRGASSGGSTSRQPQGALLQALAPHLITGFFAQWGEFVCWRTGCPCHGSAATCVARNSSRPRVVDVCWRCQTAHRQCFSGSGLCFWCHMAGDPTFAMSGCHCTDSLDIAFDSARIILEGPVQHRHPDVVRFLIDPRSLAHVLPMLPLPNPVRAPAHGLWTEAAHSFTASPIRSTLHSSPHAPPCSRAASDPPPGHLGLSFEQPASRTRATVSPLSHHRQTSFMPLSTRSRTFSNQRRPRTTFEPPFEPQWRRTNPHYNPLSHHRCTHSAPIPHRVCHRDHIAQYRTHAIRRCVVFEVQYPR